MAERLAKFMARSGVCSRRQAEEYIKQERVTVDGNVVSSPAFNVEGTEKILFDGEKLPTREETRLWLYHKPAGLVTTHKDERDRPTVFDNLPAGMPRVISVGRLDLNSEGLLLLTNDGDFANKLTHPTNHIDKEYVVTIEGEITEGELAVLRAGVVENGKRMPSAKVKLLGYQNKLSRLSVIIDEGQNRQIRRMFEAIGKNIVLLKQDVFDFIILSSHFINKNFFQCKRKDIDQHRMCLLKYHFGLLRIAFYD